MRRFVPIALAMLLPGAALAQTTTTGTVGCAALAQAAADGTTARIQADNSYIQTPQSVTNLTSLNNFFNGIGLDVVTNLLDPSNLLRAVEGQICQAVQQSWNSLIGSAQCGLTLTGFNLGFGGIGGGLSCPKLSFGGGGPAIATIGVGSSNSGGLYVNGTARPPTGYSLPTLPPGSL